MISRGRALSVARVLKSHILGANRFVWDWALGESNAAYRETGKRRPVKDLLIALTAKWVMANPDLRWLSEGSSIQAGYRLNDKDLRVSASEYICNETLRHL